MPPALLLDLTHTSHTRARTGVQRVARSLWRACGERVRPICRDPWLGAWRPLENWELSNLEAERPAAKRGARWPLRARIRGVLRRSLGARGRAFEPAEDTWGVLFPEIFSPAVARGFDSLFGSVRGPRAALFHDAIALQLPELSPPKTVERLPGYLRELLAFDGIAAVSEDSRQALLDFWASLEVRDAPPVVTIPLGIDPGEEGGRRASGAVPGDPPKQRAPRADPASERTARPAVLCVASIEGRKNHLALLDACERLWAKGLGFELHLIGLSHPGTGKAALERIAELRRAGRPLRYDGPVGEAALLEAYRACAFTVYPSLREGFGLPVLESLAHGRPCVCSISGALGETARGGGCLALDAVDAESLARGIERLLADEVLRRRLESEAAARTFRTWSDHARDIGNWMAGLARRPRTPSERISAIQGPNSVS